MLSVLRRAVAVAAVAAVSAGAVEAQMGNLKVEEIRIDLAGFEMVADQYTAFGVTLPGAIAVGIYLNDKIALEPTLSFTSVTPEGFDAVSIFSLGLFAPYYFQGDRGHNGFFVAPGVEITKITDVDALIDFGADAGYKKALNDKVSWRAALQIRSGDSTDPEMLIGGVFGLSVFWR